MTCAQSPRRGSLTCFAPLFLRHMIGGVEGRHAFVNAFAIRPRIRRARTFAHALYASCAGLIGIKLAVLGGCGGIAAPEVWFNGRGVLAVGAL